MESSEEEDDFPSIESIIPQSKVDSLYQSHTEKVRCFYSFFSQSTSNNAHSEETFFFVCLFNCMFVMKQKLVFFFSGDQEALLWAPRFKGFCGELVRQYALQVLGFLEVNILCIVLNHNLFEVTHQGISWPFYKLVCLLSILHCYKFKYQHTYMGMMGTMFLISMVYRALVMWPLALFVQI